MTSFIATFIEIIEVFLYSGVIATQVLLVSTLLWFLFDKKFFNRFNGDVRKFFSKFSLKIAWLFAFLATTGSLFFSEVVKFSVCTLCWYERIFMYPLVLIIGLGLLLKDKGFVKYVFLLSWVGLLISGYHYMLQLANVFGTKVFTPCSVEAGASCKAFNVLWFNYLTIPLMCFTAFAGIIIVLSLRRRALKKKVVKKKKSRR